MKVKCNVCLESPIIELPNVPNDENQELYCPSCGKVVAYACFDEYEKLAWSIPDSEYDENFGGIPVEILKDVIK